MESIYCCIFSGKDVNILMIEGCGKVGTQREIIGAGCSSFYALGA